MAYNSYPVEHIQTINIGAGATADSSAVQLAETTTIVQGIVSAGSNFSCWLEGSADGSAWRTLAYATATDATADASTRYIAATAVVQCAYPQVRVRVRNPGGAAADFHVSICARE